MIGTHRVKRLGRLPSHQLQCVIRRCVRCANIACATRLDIVWNMYAARGFKCSDDFEHAASCSRAQIDCKPFELPSKCSAATWPAARSITWTQSRTPVPSGVLWSPPQMLSRSRRPIATGATKGTRLLGTAFRIFADHAALTRADWIEVAQDRYPPAGVTRIFDYESYPQ